MSDEFTDYELTITVGPGHDIETAVDAVNRCGGLLAKGYRRLDDG